VEPVTKEFRLQYHTLNRNSGKLFQQSLEAALAAIGHGADKIIIECVDYPRLQELTEENLHLKAEVESLTAELNRLNLT
jgi:hypothetical protein